MITTIKNITFYIYILMHSLLLFYLLAFGLDKSSPHYSIVKIIFSATIFLNYIYIIIFLKEKNDNTFSRIAGLVCLNAFTVKYLFDLLD